MTKNRLQFLYIDINDCRPNTWNPNEQTEFMFNKTIASICSEGFVDPLTVRSLKGDTKEILDGEHRWKALITIRDNYDDLDAEIQEMYDENEALQELIKEDIMPVFDLGEIDDVAARRITVNLNNVRGATNEEKLALVVKMLAANSESLKDVASRLPYHLKELERMTKDKKLESPDDFQQFDNTISTEYRCPKCGYEWSGAPK